MKKRTIVATATVAIVAIAIAITVWVGNLDSDQLKKMDTTEIEEITIHNPAEYYTITEQEDIQTLLETLQKMNLSRKLNNSKEGFAFLIDIKLKTGKTIDLSILSEDIRINNHNYKPDKDYCNSLREIFNTLSANYKINPS